MATRTLLHAEGTTKNPYPPESNPFFSGGIACGHVSPYFQLRANMPLVYDKHVFALPTREAFPLLELQPRKSNCNTSKLRPLYDKASKVCLRGIYTNKHRGAVRIPGNSDGPEYLTARWIYLRHLATTSGILASDIYWCSFVVG